MSRQCIYCWHYNNDHCALYSITCMSSASKPMYEDFETKAQEEFERMTREVQLRREQESKLYL